MGYGLLFTSLYFGVKIMQLEQTFYASQIVAAIGVMGSLLFVGLQVRESARAVRAATTQAVHENFGELYFSLAQNPSVLQVLSKGYEDLNSLLAIEKRQFICYGMAVMSFYQNAYDQYRIGHLRSDLWNGWELLLANFAHTSGGSAFWRERGHLFGADFQTCVNDLKKRPQDPRITIFGLAPGVLKRENSDS
jgi:hypothetical protein